MKPSAATRGSRRGRIREEIGLSLSLAFNLIFSAVCTSPETPEAAISTVNTPKS
jgi:hypothetical protein